MTAANQHHFFALLGLWMASKAFMVIVGLGKQCCTNLCKKVRFFTNTEEILFFIKNMHLSVGVFLNVSCVCPLPSFLEKAFWPSVVSEWFDSAKVDVFSLVLCSSYQPFGELSAWDLGSLGHSYEIVSGILFDFDFSWQLMVLYLHGEDTEMCNVRARKKAAYCTILYR